MLFRTHRSRLFLTILVTVPPIAPAAAQGVSPADRTFLEGSTSTSYPLGRFNARIQQLHSDPPANLTQIRGHAYRRDAIGVRGTVPSFQVDMEVSLSISPRSPANASRNFADNRGPSPTVVLPRTLLDFPATDRPGQDPARNLDLMIPYPPPFAVPMGGGTLCLETVVYGNQAPAGRDRNFQVRQDAHQLFPDGRNVQPGFRFGQGCTALGASSPGFANFVLTHRGTTMDLGISARNGVPEDGSNSVWSFLMLGATPFTGPWPFRLDCTQGTSIEIWTVLGQNDTSGSWDGTLTGIPAIIPGQRFFLQVGSANLQTGALALGDTSAITIPPPGPSVIPVARIANGSNRAAASGTVSFSVPVTLFF